MPTKKKLLTTGQLAELYSVTPDAVLKWIKEGKISAIQTPGGHFRISMDDVLSETDESSDRLESQKCDMLSPYCWQFNAKAGQLKEVCSRCIVYKVRAKRCYLMNEFKTGGDHAKYVCSRTCDECEYYNAWIKPRHSKKYQDGK